MCWYFNIFVFFYHSHYLLIAGTKELLVFLYTQLVNNTRIHYQNNIQLVG